MMEVTVMEVPQVVQQVVVVMNALIVHMTLLLMVVNVVILHGMNMELTVLHLNQITIGIDQDENAQVMVIQQVVQQVVMENVQMDTSKIVQMMTAVQNHGLVMDMKTAQIKLMVVT